MHDLSVTNNFHQNFTQILADDLKSLLAQYINNTCSSVHTLCFYQANADKAKQVLSEFNSNCKAIKCSEEYETEKITSLRSSLSNLIDAAYLQTSLILFQRYIHDQNTGKYAAMYDANIEAGMRIMRAMAPLCFFIDTKTGIDLLVDAIDERVIVDALSSPTAPKHLLQPLREVLAGYCRTDEERELIRAGYLVPKLYINLTFSRGLMKGYLAGFLDSLQETGGRG